MLKYFVSLLLCGLSSVAMAEVEVVTTPLLSFPPAERLVGHTGYVMAVAYSPDGSSIVSGSGDGTVKIWNASSGKELATLSGHTGSVSAVAYSSDGSRIVSGSGDSTLKIWDASSGQKLATLRGHTDDVLAVAYSPDGSRIVSGSWDNTLKIWDANSGQLLSSLEAHTGGVSAIVFSPSGHRIYSASWDHRTIKVWSSGLGSDTETSPPVSIKIRIPRSSYNIGETLSCNLDISASSKTSESYSIYAALVYPPTEGYFITIDENKGFSLPNDIIAYRPKLELSGTKTLYPLEMQIRPSMKTGNYQCCGVITGINVDATDAKNWLAIDCKATDIQ